MPDTATLLAQVIDLIASAATDKPMRLGTPHEVKRDPSWKTHRAEARAASLGRDVCAVKGCLRAEGEPGEGYCHRHAIDEVAIERAMTGERLPLMPHERTEAIRRMHRAGYGWNALQDRLHVSGETIKAALADAAPEGIAA